ncbi:MAG TPA: helix-turn-helix transcriptional regulator [Micromonospora sp.]
MALPARFRIEGARKAAGLTQQKLANHVGVVVMTVSRWCRGETEPGAEELALLADALGVSRSWLAWGDGQPSADSEHTARVVAFVKAARTAARKREAA